MSSKREQYLYSFISKMMMYGCGGTGVLDEDPLQSQELQANKIRATLASIVIEKQIWHN